MLESNARRRPRRWEIADDDDPLAGLVNLFDLWMVFSIALLIVFVGSSKQKQTTRAATETMAGESTSTASLDRAKAKAIDRYRLSKDELTGQGEKLGIAYRLPSGEIVCVPDSDPNAISRPAPRVSPDR